MWLSFKSCESAHSGYIHLVARSANQAENSVSVRYYGLNPSCSGVAVTDSAPRGLTVLLLQALGDGGQVPKLLLRYIACTGLTNQIYSHISALSLAAVLQVRGVSVACLLLVAVQQLQ